jgi:hypothetical protein
MEPMLFGACRPPNGISRSQRLAQLPEVPALNRFREIAIVTTILLEPINLP